LEKLNVPDTYRWGHEIDHQGPKLTCHMLTFLLLTLTIKHKAPMLQLLQLVHQVSTAPLVIKEYNQFAFLILDFIGCPSVSIRALFKNSIESL
jgi:hypothetical protein